MTVNNYSLFDHFMAGRRRGYRNAWHPPAWAKVNIPVAQNRSRYVTTEHGSPESEDQILGTNVLDTVLQRIDPTSPPFKIRKVVECKRVSKIAAEAMISSAAQ